MAENIRSRQDHIEFLETYIDKLTEKIDEISGGRSFEKEIESLKFRIEVLEKANGLFPTRIQELRKELQELEAEYKKIHPIIEELVEERAYYRKLQGEI
jgi:chromosome segregation ATPase